MPQPFAPGSPPAAAPVVTAGPWGWRIGLLRTQINAGWWLSIWLPFVLGVGIAGTFALVCARWQAAGLVPWVWTGIGVALAATAAAAWFIARSRFESQASAQVLLEDALGLHARLSAAAVGVGPWPTPPADLSRRWPVAWRWGRPVGLVSLVAAMLTAAAIMPVASARGLARQVIEKPTDAAVVERWVDSLRKEQAIDEHSAESIEQKIDDLLQRPRDRWYEHASLEAAASLREQTAADIAALSRTLAEAAAAASAVSRSMDEKPTDLSSAEQNAAAAAALESALAALAAGPMQAGQDATTKGQQAGRSPEQAKALAAALRENANRLRRALAESEEFDLTTLATCESDCDGCQPCGTCAACRAGRPCASACDACKAAGRLAGKGGVSRGPGSAPLTFTERESRVATRPEQVAQQVDPERAAAGEVLEVIDGGDEPEVAPFEGPQAGGAVADPGRGGAAARIDNLLPAEQDSVRRFFSR